MQIGCRGQLDSNSREKTELFKQADQFQQLLLQKERSLQKILEEKQELQQQLLFLELVEYQQFQYQMVDQDILLRLMYR